MANQSQTAATKARETTSSPVPIHRDSQHVHDRLNNEISRRAYELYEQNGKPHGQDLVHWFQAESQILQRVPEIRESSSWYTVNVPLQGFTAEQIHISVDASRAIIAADKVEAADGSDSNSNPRAISSQSGTQPTVTPSTAPQSSGGSSTGNQLTGAQSASTQSRVSLPLGTQATGTSSSAAPARSTQPSSGPQPNTSWPQEENQLVNSNSSRESVFLIASWPNEVDPTTASAYLKNDSLTLTVKRAVSAKAATE
jgi:HSP20 family molecular chaperone IbpA